MELTTSPWQQNSCEKCGKSFYETKRLYRHLFDAHKYSKEEIEDFKKRKRNARVQKASIKKAKPVFPCEICALPYLSKLGLTSHMVTNKDVFLIHRVKFDDYDKFQDWKSEQEQQTESRFFTRSTETKCTYGRKTWILKCLHTQKTSKTVDFYHNHCPAFIRVVERNSGKCEAVACFGHLGHPHYTQNSEIIEYLKRDDPTDLDLPPPQVFSAKLNEVENDEPCSTFTSKEDFSYGTPRLPESDEFEGVEVDFLQEEDAFTS